MVMSTLQIRLSSGLIDLVDVLVESGIYANRSDVVRDAVRRLVLERMMGLIMAKKVNNFDELKEKLSEGIKNLKMDESHKEYII